MTSSIAILSSTSHLFRSSLLSPSHSLPRRMASETITSLFQGYKRLRAPEVATVEASRKKPPKTMAMGPTRPGFSITEQNEEDENAEGAVEHKLSSEVLTDNRQSCSSSEERDESGTPGQGQVELTVEQKMRMQMNKAMAHARRNHRLCEEKVAEAQAAQGLKCPRLVDLLVEKTWVDVLQEEFKKPYMEKLCQYVRQEFAGRLPIYPPLAKVFNAFNTCPFDKAKVVVLGQDPYHGPGQAMGLCFSVAENMKMPTSLVNIFKEIQDDLGCPIPTHGNLEKWAYQGVLLLNTVLTVREHHANSHAKRGWELFTDAAIRAISQQRSGVIFLLWGNSAQEKTRIINTKVHHVLKAAHPSGLSAHKGFFKCRHFSQANKILEKEGLLPIDWRV